MQTANPLILRTIKWSTLTLMLCALTAHADNLRVIQDPAASRPDLNVSQQAAQQQTQNNSKAASKQANSEGMMSIAKGAAEVAAGSASKPPNVGLIIMGIMDIMKGQKGLAAGSALGANAVQSSAHVDNLAFAPATTKFGGQGSQFQIDPALLRSGQAGADMAKVQASTGITSDQFANALNSGKDPVKLLGDKLGISASDMSKYQAQANAQLAKDEAANAAKLAAAKSSATGTLSDGSGGSTANKSSNFADLLKNMNKEMPGAGNAPTADLSKVSADVQASLNQNGMTDQSIFQMVNTQYKKVTPMMFGEGREISSIGAVGI